MRLLLLGATTGVITSSLVWWLGGPVAMVFFAAGVVFGIASTFLDS